MEEKKEELSEENSEKSLEQESEENEESTTHTQNPQKEVEEFIQKKMDEKKNQNSGGPKGPSGFNFKYLVLLIFIVIIVLSIPGLFKNGSAFSSSQQIVVKDISYSQFKELVATNKINEVIQQTPFLIGYVSENQTSGGSVLSDTSTSTVPKGTKQDPTVEYRTRLLGTYVTNDPQMMAAIESGNANLWSKSPQSMPLILRILLSSWLPLLILVFVWFYFMKSMGKGGGGGPSQIFSMGKTKASSVEKSEVRFTDVAGVDEAKQELAEVVEFLKVPEKFKKLGAKIPKGVLLLGSPGTGKTLLAKAVAGEADVPFFSISGSDFVEMFVGVGASRVRDLFGKAKKNSPCIVFIDEIDAVARQRGAGLGGGNDEREQTLNQLLVEMDGFGTDQNIIVIAATNRPDVLDPAIMRAGRFDRQVVVDRPDIKAREQILTVHAKNKKMDPSVDLKVIARKTAGFVGADLANVLNEAAIMAARANRETIMMEDIEEASEKIIAGVERKTRVITLKERNIIAYHEAGHALAAWLIDGADPVHKISIIPRGIGALGYTMQLPTEDRFLKSRTEFYNDIKILLGGRAAEQIIFNEITSGASNDIQRATVIARNMVTKYGMSSVVGPQVLGSEEDQPFLGRTITKDRNYSEETAILIDKEVFATINGTYEKVIEMMTIHRSLLERLTAELLEKEVVNGEEMEAMFAEELGKLNQVEIIS
ncbi:MAG: ATP-dependent zinc metalloprotease FtsH [Fusobacteria bacterium]|nr:ATP-dependent zinc metalloprotease FtsH [Fusobacteriota bacterium]